jgi:hypothetical protein
VTTWVDDNGEEVPGVAIRCDRYACMTDGPKTPYNKEGKYIFVERVEGYHLQPDQIETAYYDHIRGHLK